MLGNEANEESVARLRHDLGLDQPAPIQLVQWFGRLARLDLGQSLYSQEPVTQAIARNWQPTLLLTVLSIALATGLGVPLGVLAARQHNAPLDQVVMAVASLGVAVPSFWLALNLIVLFAIVLPWFPSQGYEPLADAPLSSLHHLVLPAVALGLPQVALIARMTRSSMLDVLNNDYVRTARAKGLAERRVIYQHVLRNALLPTVAVIGLSFSVVVGGAVVVEQVFTIPGLGRLVVSSIERRDYPVVQGTVLVIAAAYVLINVCLDLLYLLLDPRIRYR
jgi:peptide/nickel transport system permease protein